MARLVDCRSPEHRAAIRAGMARAREKNPGRQYRGAWKCPQGFDEWYLDLLSKVGRKEARRLIEEEAARPKYKTQKAVDRAE